MISGHALNRYRERIGPEQSLEALRGEIRLAIITGRVSDRLPNWTRGIGRSGPPETNRCFAWNEDATRCWILARPIPDGPIVVKSVVAERSLDITRANSQLLRNGMART